MGSFLNPGNELFRNSIHSQIYVDKSGMIEYLNGCINTKQKFVCVSRPRRFGKSITAEMLAAYYDRTCDSHVLFDSLKIAETDAYEEHINKYDVIHLDIQWFRSNCSDGISVIQMIEKNVTEELIEAYPQCAKEVRPDGQQLPLPVVLERFNKLTGKQFIMIIDEWDCLFREDKNDKNAQKEYIQLLRGLFKGSVAERSVSLAYMTGILPIKKYGTESALNNFDEYTMIDPGPLAEYTGFTEEEVQALCRQYNMEFEEAKRWYDGYHFWGGAHIYSPKSVVDAMRRRRFGNYWTKTETYESLKVYIAMNFDGLKDAVIAMLSGERHLCDTEVFQNDMTTFHSGDDVLTLLVHLGYLGYDLDRREVFIPNDEVKSAFVRAIKYNGWDEVIKAIQVSEELLQATWDMDEEKVANLIQEVHMQNASSLVYNNETSLAGIIALAYYSAGKEYTLIREMPAGKGFADMVFFPKRASTKPAIIVELKWDKNAEGAMSQIKDRKYVDSLADYKGNVLLVGVNYDRKTKEHQCKIENYSKTEEILCRKKSEL